MTGCFVGLFRTLVRVGSIPERLRPVIRAALDALVAGGEPELLTWVKAYGPSGAELVQQPEAIWDHPDTDCLERGDSSAFVVVPLWTTDESPSDLSAECEVTPAGVAEVIGVHVL